MDDYAPIADLYDHVGIYRDRPDVAFFVDEARRAGGPVLELGCGTGRVLIPTARAGVSITGLDASASMLDICRSALLLEPLEVRRHVSLVEGDMRGFDLGRRFRLVTLPFRPFQHLVTVAEQLECLAAIHRHLEPGGRLILDLFNPSFEGLSRPIGVESEPEAEFTTPDGRRVVRRHLITARDRPNQVNDVDLIYDVIHPDGRTERLRHSFRMRYLFRFEAEHLLVRAGYAVQAVFGGYDRSPFGSVDPGELILVAEPA